jgi:hypothetical protein
VLGNETPDYEVVLSPKHPDFREGSRWITNWDDNYRSLPVDVNIMVQDSMETDPSENGVGIIESWSLFYNSLINNKSVRVDLTNLRPAGTENDSGLIASGPIGKNDNESNFASIYHHLGEYHYFQGTVLRMEHLLVLLGSLNEAIRRGGFKRGIICTSMSYKNPYFSEYLKVDQRNIPGSLKKAARVDQDLPDTVIPEIVKATRDQGIFWEKIHPDPTLFQNVCEGIFLRDKGTCLLWRINLGMCRNPRQVVEAFRDAAASLTNLHMNWRQDSLKSGKPIPDVLPVETDLQIGLDVAGLANLLALWGITYQDFKDSLDGKESSDKASDLKSALAEGYRESLRVVDDITDSLGMPRMERVHTVEPQQSHSYEMRDYSGYTIARGIWPPIAQKVLRKSDTESNRLHSFGPVETMQDFPPGFNMAFSDSYYKFMREHGRAHAISVDDWTEATVESFKKWLYKMALPSKYYHESNTYKEQAALRKRVIEVCSVNRPDECSVCAE